MNRENFRQYMVQYSGTRSTIRNIAPYAAGISSGLIILILCSDLSVVILHFNAF